MVVIHDKKVMLHMVCLFILLTTNLPSVYFVACDYKNIV